MADLKLDVQQQPHAGGSDYGIVILVVGFLAAAALLFFAR